MIELAPSILSADFARLGEQVHAAAEGGASVIHVDIMDGVFVPNISFGFPVVKAIKKHAKKPLDVHLMIANPDSYLKEFKEAGADNLSVHYEGCTHLHRTIHAIRDLGMKAGVAINPHTPVNGLQDIISETDLVIVMSVNPGFGGQKFIESTFQKVKYLKQLIKTKKSHARIEVDGGVDLKNAPVLVKEGANVLVAGNTVFGSKNPTETISLLKNSK